MVAVVLALALLELIERDGLVLGLLRLDVLDPGVPDRAEEDRRDRCRATSGERKMVRWACEERGQGRCLLGDDFCEEPHPEEGGSDATHGRGHHVRDGGGDLDRHETGDAHEETEDALRENKTFVKRGVKPCVP